MGLTNGTLSDAGVIMNSRKVVIFTVSFLAILAVFLIYNGINKNSSIDVQPRYNDTARVDSDSKFDNLEATDIGDAVVGETLRSEYKMWDSNKRLTRKFGFEKLLHSEGLSWDVLSPSMNIYGKKFKCSIVSKDGHIRMTKIDGKPTPAQAKLSGNVVINIEPYKNETGTIKIYLDDLVFNNERSEYSTNGPIKLVSDTAVLNGRGLNLVYNSTVGRVEFLKITKLDKLIIKDYGDKDKKTENASSALKNTDSHKTKQIETTAKTNTKETSGKIQSYRCELDSNVVISTSQNQMITADLVAINNILLDSQDEDSGDANNNSSDNSSPAKEGSADQINPKQANSSASPNPSDSQKEKRIIVTCSGSLVLKPVDVDADQEKSYSLDFTGSPVKISVNSESVASCSKLHYDVENESVKLSSGADQEDIVLNMQGKDGYLLSKGEVFLDRKSNFATVKGPGAVHFKSQKGVFKMDFDDLMEMSFTEAKANTNNINLKTLKISGGMNAILKGDQTSSIASKRAKLDFDNNKITHADLDDDVHFENPNGELLSDHAEILFSKSDSKQNKPYKVLAKGNSILKPKEEKNGPTIFNADSIEYDLLEQRAVASAPIKLDFFMPSSQNKADGNRVPVVVRAKGNAKFDLLKNKVTFNDDVNVNIVEDHILYKQVITLDSDVMLVEMAGKDIANSNTQVKRFYASGNPVKLKSIREVSGEVIQKTLLSSEYLEYKGDSEILSSGAGKIEFDNSKAASSKNVLKGPSYGIIEDFTNLDWNTKSNNISIYADNGIVHMGFVPVLDGGALGSEKLMDAGRINIQLAPKDTSSLELSTLKASESVLYQEPKLHQFVGDNLFYDASTGEIVVRGSKRTPCMLDNNIVKGIEYNLINGSLKTKLSGRSSIR